jgi:hypothetical protein
MIFAPFRLPISMPRGYGEVAVIWKNEIDHLVRPIQDGSEKIQARMVIGGVFWKILQDCFL